MVSSEGACAAYYSYRQGRMTRSGSRMRPASSLQCPIPISDYPTVTLAHGGGGRLTQMLIERMFLPAFGTQPSSQHDGAMLPLLACAAAGSGPGGARLQHRLLRHQPALLPRRRHRLAGGHGTVNDLAMCGAQPLALSAGFILEEGLPMDELWRIVQSMQAAARPGVRIVTGDTKVVDRGKGDGVYINTAGIGLIPPGSNRARARAARRSGAAQRRHCRHGIAIMSVREGLAFETALASDSAPLHGLVAACWRLAASRCTCCVTRRAAAWPAR